MNGNSGKAPAWSVFVGPGPRLAVLPQLLGALRPDPTWEVRALADVDELFGPLAPSGCLVLDCDQLDLEDLGFIRRFMDRHEGWDLVLTGIDSTARTGKRLLAQVRTRWMDWPLDVDQVRALWVPRTIGDPQRALAGVTPPDFGEPPVPRVPVRFSAQQGLPETSAASATPISATPRPASPQRVPTDDDAEMTKIRSILEGLPEMRKAEDGAPLAPGPQPFAVLSNGPLPGYFREQVADLADIAQRLQLSTAALQESAPAGSGLDAQLQGVDQDVSRLMQFTRTLGFLAAPPATGNQNIDVGGLLEELLGSLAGSTSDAPRYLFRSAPGLAVRSDKMLLVQAFDAMLQLATRCAGADDVVRVAAHAQAPATDGDQVEVRISFPAGPLADMEPDRILRPYALRRILPSIGPNALAAAGGIVRGQGGQLDLEEIEPGRLTWTTRFPSAESRRIPDPS